MRRPLSIRSRLLLLLSVATVVVWTAAVTLSYLDARRELNELFDAQLAESAEVLLRQARHELRGGHERDEDHEVSLESGIDHPYARQLHFQVWDRERRLVYRSSPDLPPEPLIAGPSRGFADRTLHGVRWRVAVLTDPESGLELQVCQSYEAREGVAAAIARNMFTPLAAAVPVLAVLVWLAAGRGIRPLGLFARELQERTPDNLEAVDGRELPRELEPVAGALNGLLERLRARLDLERRFTADAAHELRTPLAALKTQAQVALGARSAEERAHAISQIVRGTDRMTHLVSRLLTLARVDPEMTEPAERIDLGDVVRESAGTFASMALEREIDLEVQAAGDATILGNRSLISTLVGNLVENAILYSRKGGRVRVSVERKEPSVLLRVSDDGPGIPPEERARVFDRFYRGAAARERGSGLGLSIVKRIADLHGAVITLSDTEGGGFEVVTRF